MNRLETLSNVAVIVAAAVVIGTNVYGHFAPQVNKVERGLSLKLAGKSLALPTSLPIGRQGTLTAFVSSDCHFCQESMGFYRRLASLTHADSSCDVKFVAVGPSAREKREGFEAFLTGENLRIDGVDVVNYASLGISGTPALVLRDSSQIVRNVWTGFCQQAARRTFSSGLRRFAAIESWHPPAILTIK